MDAKKFEVDYLEKEYSKIQIEYKSFQADKSGYFREVGRYETILRGVHPKDVSV